MFIKKQFRVILITLISLFLCSCSIQTIDIGEIKDYKINQVANGKIKASITIPITNNNNFKVKIIRANVDIISDGSSIGRVTLDSKIVLPKDSTQDQTIPLEIDMPDMFTGGLTLMKLFASPTIKIRLNGDITGSAFLKRKKVPINQELTIKLNKNKKENK